MKYFHRYLRIRYDEGMIFCPTRRNQSWYRLTCLLLALTMIMAPMVSVLAEQHESLHIVQDGMHFDDHASSNLQVSVDHSDNIEKNSGLHGVAHASHCCGQAFAVLSDSFYFRLSPIVSTLSVSVTATRYLQLKISHFRPPIA